MKRQEKRRRKLLKKKQEARTLRQVTAVLAGVRPDQVGQIKGHKFELNHKGSWCNKFDRLCQEGYCSNCWLERTAKTVAAAHGR